MNKKNKFLLNDFVNIPNILRKINYLKINLGIYLFVYDGIKRKKNNFEFILYDETKFKNYYLDFDFYIDEKEISKYKKIKIEGLSKLNNIKTYNLELIEDNNANLCYINFNINKHYIKSLKEIKSIYCEKEIQNTNFILIIKKIINGNGFQKLKYINLTIGNNKVSYNNLSYNNIYNYLFKLINNSENLKSLILRFTSQIYDLSFINHLKNLKIVNIQDNNGNKVNLIKEFPNLKNKLYNLDDKFNKNNYIECVHRVYKNKLQNKIKLLNYISQYNKDIQMFYNKKEEMKEYFELYLNEEMIDFCFDYNFKKIGKNVIKIKCKISLINMSHIFYECTTLTSLNLSLFL